MCTTVYNQLCSCDLFCIIVDYFVQLTILKYSCVLCINTLEIYENIHSTIYQVVCSVLPKKKKKERKKLRRRNKVSALGFFHEESHHFEDPIVLRFFMKS